MKIDNYISDLLYNHDCVIVPSFGGFLASYQPTEFHPTTHTFYPPSKKIAFNIFLKNNDGLLANYIAQKENVNYSNALKGIDDFRLDINKQLNSDRKIVIEDVGTLYYDQYKNLQFEPAKTINYLEDSFGLISVQSPPVKREEQKKKIERQIQQAVSLRPSVKASRNPQRLTVKKIHSTFLIGGALIWFGFNVYLVAPHKGEVSSINPIPYKTSTANMVESLSTKPTTQETAVASAAPVQKAEDSSASTETEQSSQDNSLALASPSSFKKPELETILQSQKNFFVIAGVFKEPGNAEKLLASLKKEGFIKAEIINPNSPVKKVCYSSFAYKKDAMEALQQLHSFQRDAWIMEK